MYLMKIYSIFDKVSEEYGPLIECVNDGVALRQFEHILKKMDEADRDDLVLYRLGEFERSLGSLIYTPGVAVVKEVNDGTGV
jgi:Mg2+ and Co2+ transporter CorA